MLVSVFAVFCLLAAIQTQSTPNTALHAGFVYDSSHVSTIYCTSNNPVSDKSTVYGDFNGDGRTDYFCNAHAIGQVDRFSLATPSGIFNHLKTAKTELWCDYSEGELLTGDFNGDGREDLLCRYRSGDKYEISEFEGPSFTPSRSIMSDLNCITSSTTLFLIGDLDGDNTDDFVCADLAGGIFKAHFNHYRHHHHHLFQRSDQILDISCIGSASRVLLCDVNGDRKDDFICHDTVTRTYSVWYTDQSGHYKKVELPYVFGGSSRNIVTGHDVDGNGKCDISCLLSQSGSNQQTEELILYNEGNNQYSHRGLNLANPNIIACELDYLKYGDFNGDGMIDLACDEPGLNPLKIFYSTLR